MQGDNDPVDVVEIGSKPCQMGGVFRVKPLGESGVLGGMASASSRLLRALLSFSSVFPFQRISVSCHSPQWVSTGPVKCLCFLSVCFVC